MDKDRIIGIIKKFSDRRIAVVGDPVLDIYFYGSIKRLNPESAAPLITIEDGKEEYKLGCAANVALNSSSLEAKVDLYGAVGNDDGGKMINKLCLDHGISFVEVKEGKTIIKQRFIDKSHKHHYLMRADFGESDLNPLGNKNENILYGEFFRNTKEYEGVILSDYNKRVLRGDLGPKVIALADELGIKSIVDPKPLNNFIAFRGTTLVRPNLSEARAIVGKNNLNDEELALHLKEIMQSDGVVITCGSEGAFVYDCGFYHIPTKAREVVDVTGAGDTFTAALMLSFLSGASIMEAAHIANHAAGIVVEKPGTASLTQQELIERILHEDSH